VFEAGRIRADSTDGGGLMAALADQSPGLLLPDQPVVVLGAGGAARAAVLALKAAGARVGVLNRTLARAESLAAQLGVRVLDADALDEAVLVVNALAVPPDIDMSRLRPDTILMDMTYRPLVTAFLAQGRDRGLTTVDGLTMLIGQARPSFRALFGVDPPPVDVRSLALRELRETP
jgi:shikimate dehydrogenase